MALLGWERRVRAVAFGVIVSCSTAWLVACGPIEYVNQVSRGADDAVAAARTANAAKWSPYWWTRAVEYLHQAREKAASADFQAANRFGRLSEEAATKARDEALKRQSDPEAAKELDYMTPSTSPTDEQPARGGNGLAPAIDGTDDKDGSP